MPTNIGGSQLGQSQFGGTSGGIPPVPPNPPLDSVIVYRDCVCEVSTSSGYDAIQLEGPVDGFTTFHAALVPSGSVVEYSIRHTLNDLEWEAGRGEFNESGGTGSVTRTSPTQSSAGQGLRTFFSHGLKHISLSLSEGFLNAIQPLNERVQDAMALAFATGVQSGLTIAYDDVLGAFSFTVTDGGGGGGMTGTIGD